MKFPNFYKASGTLDMQKLDAFMEEKKFTLLGEGRHRRTYLSPNKRYVLKFPHGNYYFIHNQNEARIWRQFFSNPNPDNCGCIYAPCRLIDNSILMMRAMSTIFGITQGDRDARCKGLLGENMPYRISEDCPEWVKKSYYDSHQVGKLCNTGKYAIYDYG